MTSQRLEPFYDMFGNKARKNWFGFKYDPQETQWRLWRPSRVSSNHEFVSVRNSSETDKHEEVHSEVPNKGVYSALI